MNKTKVLSIIGTRPEVIKMAPIIKELNNRESLFRQIIVTTGQHKEMCKPYMELFSIKPDFDLAIMQQNQTPDNIIANILNKLPDVIENTRPDIVLVQGDTSSALGAALAAYHSKTRVGHVEAGLRTNKKYNPFPEEANRHLIGVLADYHLSRQQAHRIIY